MKVKHLAIYGCVITILFQLTFFYQNIGLLDLFTCSVFSSAIWLGTACVTLGVRKKVPGINNRNKRLRIIMAQLVPLTVACTLLNGLLEQLLNMSKIRWQSFVQIEGMTIIISLVVVGIYEGLYYIKQWQQLHEQSEQLRKINFDSQYKFLEDQIKPHFLFNSLNTLSSLIHADPDKAEHFVEEMSSVYRYLLRKNQRELTTLQEELAFIESYVLMLKTRFDDALLISIDIGEQHLDYLLPPFVLQLLVENAVKHNVATPERPLKISIHTDGAHNLHIENNLQKKDTSGYSEKTGLLNLTERYRLLEKSEQLYILEETHRFKVIVPLIHTDQFSPIHVSKSS
ncbi:hypothetical protein EGT74_00875 [Chitinophaga lutea]|uniref:Signal transduction histidine kinase internal region domain-containing protein n=1 Tax=Chitinophaga lutea TaxID=2488634 RepID=A0A3N4QK45_9BACT|nr:histidine kinase [Chitinophaga lutea]RPE12144.1 hypothetical protein EGT74_00875 [Chitinophaga lutea]